MRHMPVYLKAKMFTTCFCLHQVFRLNNRNLGYGLTVALSSVKTSSISPTRCGVGVVDMVSLRRS